MTKVRIVEVGPRDGLQNEKKIIATKDKFEFVQGLVEAGLTTIEVTSFVRADRIPQMQDSEEMMKLLRSKYSDLSHFACLVPNLKGLENANKSGVEQIAIFTATSNEFNKKNINATVDESLERLSEVAVPAKKEGKLIRGYISTVFGCPYEGKTSVDTLCRVAQKLFDLGCYEISLGDTTGVANPSQVRDILNVLKKNFDLSKFSMHFHDTWGIAVANSLAAYEEGARSFDSSAGGLGGCPYAKGATGNVATEDLYHLFSSLGVDTGIDIKKLVQASSNMLSLIGRESASKFHHAFINSGGLN